MLVSLKEKAHQLVDDGDGYYDDIIYNFFTANANIEDFEIRTISFKDIPDDLEEMIDEGEFVHGNFSKNFEEAMFYHELMAHGSSRRSHRIITDKSIDLGLWGTIELLTGKTKEDIENTQKEELTKNEIKKMFSTAREYGYVIIEKDLRKYL